MVKWTPEQEDAIYMKGSDILVSAAAGSGKTAVLVERIIKRLLDEEDPINIDEILVVTFTNAAAAEMKSRIGHALENALIDYPGSLHLKKQLSLLPRAQISTLHSFYTRVVRQYAYLFDLDPAFSIADEMEIDLIKQDVIDDLFEEYYSKDAEELERFFSVVDRYSSDRSDVSVESLILDLYEFAMQNPAPEKWLDKLARVYDIDENVDEESIEWLNLLKNEVRDLLDSFKENIIRALMITDEGDGPYHYKEALEADLNIIKDAMEKSDKWDDLQEVFMTSKRKRLSGKRVECDEDKKEYVKALRERYTKGWDKLKKDWFSRHLQAHLADMRELYPVVQTIVELVKEFKVLFTKEKRERALVDFLDLEHLCLAVFTDETSQAPSYVKSHIAKNYKEKFKEILIDEYQDINYVQETILSLISDDSGDGNRFMVGDVKQSIYRFRHAEPTLFIEKYEDFLKDESTGRRIDLAKNFRSRETVLTGANYLFRQIFDIELGEISYDEKAELIYGNKAYDDFPVDHDRAELLLVDCDKDSERYDQKNEQFEEMEKAQLEARAYVKKIKHWLGDEKQGIPPLQVFDKRTEQLRDVQFRDIAILHRSLTWAQVIVDELKDANIPVYAEIRDGYFEAIEIKVMISFLKIIDNPYQDIPLASVLRSPIVDLNEEDLMTIRLIDKNKALFGAVKDYEKMHKDELSERLGSFLRMLESFRRLAKEGALSELIWQIYRETAYYDFVGGMPSGRQGQANLRALYDRARSYEATSFRGLFRFLRFIERMEEEDKDLGAAKALSEEEDVVKLMTIHKSKGLEFPLVIVGGMNREFNLQDMNKKYLLDKDYGFATKYIDPIKQINYPTLYFHSLREEMLKKQLAEEMRVLYVALTRAREKLVMVGTVDSVEKLRKKWSETLEHDDVVLAKQVRKSAKTFLDWVGPSLVRHEDNTVLRTDDVTLGNLPEGLTNDHSNWLISILHGSELTDSYEQEEADRTALHTAITEWKVIDKRDDKLEKYVNDRLAFTYEHEEATRMRAKQSVTEIKRQREIRDDYSDEQLIKPFKRKIGERPLFMQSEKQLSSAERGTAIHTVMQHLPLNTQLTQDEIEEYLQVFVDKKILREEELAVIDTKMIEHFFKTDLADMIMESERIEKEVPFTFTLHAADVYANWTSDTDEKVLIQGVIDLLIYNEGAWSIIDYKTDSIPEAIMNESVINNLKERYRLQVELYKQAVQSIIKEPIKHVYLHFLDKQLTIEL